MRTLATIAVAALVAVLTGAQVCGAEPLACTRVLRDRLVRTGRAEARVTQTVTGGDGGATLRGRIALEASNQMRLDFATTGERLAVRGDGGEWLQPTTRQLVILKPDAARQAASLWRVLREEGGGLFREQKLGARRYQLVARDEGGGVPESLRVEVGVDGLPAMLEVPAGDLCWTWRFSSWRFAASRGRSAFVLSPPPGYTVVEMP